MEGSALGLVPLLPTARPKFQPSSPLCTARHQEEGTQNLRKAQPDSTSGSPGHYRLSPSLLIFPCLHENIHGWLHGASWALVHTKIFSGKKRERR